MTRLLMLVYGAASYVLFLVALVWAVAWLADFSIFGLGTIDGGPSMPWREAIPVDAGLLALFALHHSVFARPAVKRRLAAVVPAAIERSTYVLVASLLLLLVLQAWRPMTERVWQVEGASAVALWALQAFGWTVVLASTFMISHFELFGLRQVWQHWRGRPEAPLAFFVRGLYRLVRHPLMLGFVIAFWATPTMSVGHLLFSGMTTVWILVALQFEEHDLRSAFGARYVDYQREVPMLVPGGKLFTHKSSRQATEHATEHATHR
ncbi:MAG: putative conserved integral rane protein [Rhizobacter sp.]|nr:putative conserved integral rane protein [Rhizobacter sp.]